MPTISVATPALTVLSEEESMFRDAVREFAETEIRPHVHAMDEAAQFRPDLIPKFFELGLMGIEVPEEYGGSGGTIFMAVLAIEELARVDASAAIYVDVHNTLVNNAILRWANSEQQARYFPRLTTKLLGAFALSEPGSGSDAFALATRAERKGDDWVLTGRKFWITNGAEAGLFIVFANADPSKGYKGITGFLVERGFPGFSIGKKENKLGIRASSTTELILEECVVPSRNVLGPVGQGYKISIETLNEGRIGIGAQMIGVASGALQAATAYVKERQQFGKAIAEFPGGAVPAGADGHRPGGGAADGLQRGAAQGRQAAIRPAGRDGQAVQLPGGRPHHLVVPRAVRRLRLLQGVSGREVLP